MRLTALEFNEGRDSPNEWRLEGLTLGPANLLVGRNATGKSRVINVIVGLANLLSGRQKEVSVSAFFEATFDHEGQEVRYVLDVEVFQVTREEFLVAGDVKLSRGAGGVGRILAEDIEGKPTIRFQTSTRELGVVARRDAIQHKFLEPLHQWGASVLHYEFGKGMGHTNLGLAVKVSVPQPQVMERDQVVVIFNDGLNRFKDAFINAVVEDMRRLSYDVEAISLAPPRILRVDPQLPGDLVGVAAKEKSLRCLTDQLSMSQGMFRVFSLLIQLNHAILSRRLECVLIDDVGEGLDFERSCDLVTLLREKAKKAGFQLVMSTNDRFVMNKVPLEEWCVLQRHGQAVTARHYRNSREAFERFRRTGLNNFDLLATDYLEGK